MASICPFLTRSPSLTYKCVILANAFEPMFTCTFGLISPDAVTTDVKSSRTTFPVWTVTTPLRLCSTVKPTMASNTSTPPAMRAIFFQFFIKPRLGNLYLGARPPPNHSTESDGPRFLWRARTSDISGAVPAMAHRHHPARGAGGSRSSPDWLIIAVKVTLLGQVSRRTRLVGELCPAPPNGWPKAAALALVTLSATFSGSKGWVTVGRFHANRARNLPPATRSEERRVGK